VNFSLIDTLLLLPGIIIGLTVHEFSHAYTAYKLGDNTARDAGRLTLNPLSHLDPLGFFMLLLFRFGWAKPVPFNSAYFKNPSLDSVKVAVMGPVSNILLAVVFIMVLKVYAVEITPLIANEGFTQNVFIILEKAVWINIALFVFNLLPVPPLDGSYLLVHILPDSMGNLKTAIMQYGAYLIVAILIAQNIFNVDILPIGRITDSIYDFLRNAL
jgi:Zn-dependent protease